MTTHRMCATYCSAQYGDLPLLQLGSEPVPLCVLSERACEPLRAGTRLLPRDLRRLPLSTVGTAADTSQPFQIPLQVGWNLIGNPFTFDVSWSQVQFIDPDTNTAVSLPTAVGKGIVANALWGYSFGSYSATTRMKIWEGYWVYAYRATTLIIPPSAAATSASSRSALSEAGGWRLTLEVQSGDLKDRAYIGVSRSATPGYDAAHDLLKPPPVSADYVHISLPRVSWGAQSGTYGVDIQPAHPQRELGVRGGVQPAQPRGHSALARRAAVAARGEPRAGEPGNRRATLPAHLRRVHLPHQRQRREPIPPSRWRPAAGCCASSRVQVQSGARRTTHRRLPTDRRCDRAGEHSGGREGRAPTAQPSDP
jgi:hypothetical protein